MHPGQLAVSPQLVRALVDEQFPRWRGLEIKAVNSSGTVNAIYRIGDGLAARFPLQGGDAGQARRDLEAEAAAARKLAGRTRFATPEPAALGEPGAGYPMPWSVQTWLPGTTADDHHPGESVAFAHDLAEFIGGVRAIDVGGRTFSGHGRGGVLRDHDAFVQTCLARSRDLLEVPRLERIWARMRELPRGADPDVMSHQDLIPGNVLVSRDQLNRDRLAGVLDVGGLGPADPALDLVGGWHLLEAGPRQVLRDDLGVDEPTWRRGQGWAFQQAIGAAWYYAQTNPAMSRMGLRTLRRLQEAAPDS
jgi:aminoglycoside phosphotransferase (APT) family kinase protein